jgi:transcriptional regulator with XRE-family HTH domain
MKRLGVTPAALASAVGINVRTLRNIACGSAPNRRARQAITTALGAEVWSGMLPADRRLNFECGSQTEFATVEDAKEWAREFPGHVRRRGKVVTYIRSASFVIFYDAAWGSHSAHPTRKIFESVGQLRHQQ